MIEAIRALLATLSLAAIMAGETPGCPVGQVAVGQVFDNRAAAGITGGWFGRAQPGGRELVLALTRSSRPDLVDGAIYAIQPADRARMPFLRRRLAVFACPMNDLEVWR